MRTSNILVCTLLALSLVAARGRLETKFLLKNEAEPLPTKPAEAEPTEAQPVETEPLGTEPVEGEPVEADPEDVQPKEAHAGSTGLWCKTCNVFVTVLDKILNMKEVDDFLAEYFEKHVCPLLPEEYLEECLKDAPKIIPNVLHFIENLATSALCSGMGVCDKKDLRTMAFHDHQVRMVNQVRRGNDELCDACHEFTTAAEKQVAGVDPEDIMNWKGELIKACDKVPEEMKSKCKSLVERYSYLLVFYLLKEKEEGHIAKACEDLDVCPSDNLYNVPPLQLSLVKKMAGTWIGANQEDPCNKCIEIAKRTEGSLAEPEFMNEIGDYIVRVCKWVPPIKEKCTETLRHFSDMFFSSLLKVIAPEAICSDLGFCGNGDVPEEVQLALDMDVGSKQKIVYVQ